MGNDMITMDGQYKSSKMLKKYGKTKIRVIFVGWTEICLCSLVFVGCFARIIYFMDKWISTRYNIESVMSKNEKFDEEEHANFTIYVRQCWKKLKNWNFLFEKWWNHERLWLVVFKATEYRIKLLKLMRV